LLTAEDARRKVRTLEVRLLLAIADMFCVRKSKKNACYQRIQNIRNIHVIHHSFTTLSFTLQNFHSLWGELFTRLRSTVLNYVQHIFPGEAKNFPPLLPLSYGPDNSRVNCFSCWQFTFLRADNEQKK